MIPDWLTQPVPLLWFLVAAFTRPSEWSTVAVEMLQSASGLLRTADKTGNHPDPPQE